MAATGRGDWRSARSSEGLPPHLGYSRSYDHPPPAPAAYYGDSLPPSHSWGPGGSSPYHPHSAYGRAGGPPPPHYPYPSQHQQHSPIASRDRDPDPYWDGPLSPTPSSAYDRTQPLPPYSGSSTPFRGSSSSAPPAARPRSQVIHRGSPFSSRGGGSAAARSFDRQFFPDSPYRSNRPPPGTMTTRIVLPMHRQHLPLSRNSLPPAWEPPSPLEVPAKRGSHDEEDDDDDDDGDYVASTVNREPKAQDGSDDEDPLAILAKVSSDMDSTKVKSRKTDDEDDEERGEDEQASSKPTEPPTSPLTRRTRSSPVITPTTDNTTNKQRKAEVTGDLEIPQPPAAAVAAAKAAAAPAPAVAPSVNPPPPNAAAAAAPNAGKGTPKSVTPMPAYYPPPYGEDPHGPPPHHHHHPYNASSGRAPSAGYRPYAPPPARQTLHHRRAPSWGPEVHPAVVERHSFDSFDSAASNHESPSLPPPANRRGYYPYATNPHGTNPHGPPPQHYPPPRYYGGPPGGSDPYHHRPPYPYPPQHAASHMDEKTILRRKFSWKHYPELERFLIANRDEYLEHSSKNYTAEQKQFNNWLTEQLIQVAERHGYVFDPEEFNFVAIRDRIRCYYKSYVQTARKRGLELPGQAHIKKQRPANSLDKYAEEKERKEAEQRRREAESSKGGGDSATADATPKDSSSRSGESKEKETEAVSTKEKEEPAAAVTVKAVEAN